MRSSLTKKARSMRIMPITGPGAGNARAATDDFADDLKGQNECDGGKHEEVP